MERASREIEHGGDAYRAVEAWRGASGHGLCYFVALDGPGGSPLEGDEHDLRAPLPPGERLADLSSGRLEELLDDATSLTVTERRFEAPDGRLWLAQSVGPVWSEAGVAEGTTGVKFTSLEGARERLESDDGHVGLMERRPLETVWRRAGEGSEATGETSEPEA